MSARAPAGIEPAPFAGRHQVLDDGWLLMLLAAALAVAIPWFLRNALVEMGPIAWAVFSFGVGYLALSRFADRVGSPRVRAHALTALQAVAIVFVALAWHLAGSVQNPLLLMLFALPVAAAACVLPAARALLLAGLAVMAATVVALANVPQLGWYLTQLGLPPAALPPGLAAGPRPFPGLDVPVGFVFTLLATFAVLIFAVALLGRSVAALLRDLQARLADTQHALAAANSLAAEVIATLPHPTVLVYADTFNVAQASASFLQRMDLVPESLQEKNLFELVDFAYPEVVRETIASGRAGEVPVASYRGGGIEHSARVLVAPVEHAGAWYACVTLVDVAGSLARDGALDALGEALVVIGGDQRVRYFNAAAARLFPALEPGADAAAALAGDEAAGWWVLGPRAQRERTLAVGGKAHVARCSALEIPGLAGRHTVVALRPAGP